MNETATFCSECGRKLGSTESCQGCADVIRARLEKDAAKIQESDLARVLKKATQWLAKTIAPKELTENVNLLVPFVRDWSSGRYTEAPWRSVAMIGATLLYVFSPFDFVPDFIPFAGWLDDMFMVKMLMKAIGGDLLEYKSWRARPERLNIIDLPELSPPIEDGKQRPDDDLI